MDTSEGAFDQHKQPTLRRAEQSSHSLAQHSASTTTSSSLNYVSVNSSLHSRQPSYVNEYQDDEEQQEQVDSFAAWDHRLDPPYEGVHFHDISASRSFPSSTSLASPSTEDSPHELYSASETPFFAPPPPTAPYSAIPFTSERSNHVPRTLSHARNRPTPLILDSTNAQTIAADPSSRQDDPLPVKTPSTASTIQHVRIGSKPSARGFPYTSSVLATSTSCAHLRGGHVLDSETALTRAQKRLSKASGGSGEDGSLQSHRSSSDVDLDLSFDLHEESGEESAMQMEQEKARWVGIDMQQVVESQDEEKKGKKRVQSAVDIRAAYLAGEKAAAEAAAATSTTIKAAPAVAILMNDEPTTSTYAAPPSNRSSWIRKPSADGGILPIATSSTANPRPSRKNIPAPLEPTYKRLSTGRGYAFNPTDPISVPLPDSPDGPAPSSSTAAGLKSEWEGSSSSKAFPRPLNLIERTRNLSLSSSAGSTSGTWNIGAIFAGGPSKDKGKGKEVERGATPTNGGREEDLEFNSPRPSWADTTREYLRGAGGKGKQTRRTASDAASPETSPLFESEGEGSSRTAPTTPNDTPQFPDEHYRDDDEPVQATFGRSAKKGRLDGLGLDFTGETVDEARPLPARPVQPTTVSRPGHVTIPSLSIIPPDDDDDDSVSVSSTDSAADPTVSPSRRLSNRSSSSSHDRPTARVHYPPSTNDSTNPTTRRLFGPAASHLLVSETMPHAQLPHQTSLSSSRFSFTPAPLQLVRDQLLRATSSISGGRPTSPSPSPARPTSRLSMASFSAMVHTHPGTWLEETVPAKLAFLAGFILGPWCWIIGGWWLRHGDGELRSTSARRCREEGCNCGRLVQWYSVANSRRHAKLAGRVGSKGAVADEWAGLDQWVFLNRAAAVGSGSVVVALVAVAIWAAAAA
ncbi:hypothetical protein BCR35DRAFT_354656 [Leucosporidium creatinivorum]|uniref:Uncharacterized protein n=1 Tax=Leucosporidium creatinivorum TaxID=106004 RepID=A0A1Y2ECK4_9BASI|nr:hypothetical protein BCR35DRAFT_354656 [Leucosporidium creatinivorum]